MSVSRLVVLNIGTRATLLTIVNIMAPLFGAEVSLIVFLMRVRWARLKAA